MRDLIEGHSAAIKLALLFCLVAGLGWWWSSDPPLEVGPSPGRDGRVLILLHGHGASKRDLKPLAEQLGESVPEMTFIMPSAPHRVGLGKTWYPSFTTDSKDEVEPRLRELRAEARQVVTAIIDELIADGVPADQIFVGGFSQGATVALDVVLAAPGDGAPAGLVSLSGGALSLDLEPLHDQDLLRAFVSHGKRDRVLGAGRSRSLVKALRGGGHEVEFIQFDGGHAIPPQVVTSLGTFLGGS
jgi:phospholipase/carboxylesterase